MSLSISLVLRKDKMNAHGCFPISVRVTIDRKSRYIPTEVSVPNTYWDQAHQKILDTYPSATVLQLRIDTIKVEWMKKVERLQALGERISFLSLFGKDRTVAPKSSCTVEEYFKKQIDWMTDIGKIGTAGKYKYCFELLKKSNCTKIRFDEVDMSYLRQFETYLIKKGNKNNSIATKFSVFRAVYNKAARERLFTIEDDPFKKFKPGRYWSDTRKRAIKKEDIQRIKSLEIPEDLATFSLSFARDVFLFSYYVAGINFKDIASLRYENLVDGRIYYQRHKTGKELNYLIRPEIKEILERYLLPEKHGSDYVFPILDRTKHITEQQIFNREHKVLRQVNDNLKVIAGMANVNCELTTYVARHTFATVLKRSGVSVEIISESLGHSDLATTQIYLDSFENNQIDEAMNNLL